MSTTARTIHLPGTTALAAVAQRVRAALVPWAADWMIGGGSELALPAIETRALVRDAALSAPEFEQVQTKSGTLWVRRNVADVANLGRVVVGTALMPRNAWADETVADLVEQAWSARNRAVVAALLNASPESTSARTELPESLFGFGAGSVHLSCELLGLNVVADHSVWRSVPPSERARTARPALTPLDSAVKQPTARIEVVLGSVELDLSNVFDLRSGDVLRLPQRLDEGLSILCEGHPFARGALGERDGRVCVSVMNRSVTP